MNESKLETIIAKIWYIIKLILLTITAPVWYPWKLLFVRKEGRKFSEVDSKTKTFRIVRAPITKTLKFMLFIFIILLELLIVHKVRYSALTYPFTKNAVVNYYLNENRVELEGIDGDYKQEFETAFNYIDTWDLNEKNKMNVILNSNFIKESLKYVDNETISYILLKFNNDDNFREEVRLLVKDINELITRLIKEIPEEDFNRLNNFLNPIVTVGSWAIDYAGALDIGDAVFDWYVNEYNIKEKSLHITSENIEKAIKSGIDYRKGASLKNIYNYWR